MSYTTIIAVWPGEKSECLEELQNGFGSGPLVWGDMCQRYLRDGKRNDYMFRDNELWPLANRLDIPYHHRAVLAMTYDRMFVKREHYSQAAQCIRKYLADFPVNENYVNHWPRIAELFESDPDYPAIALWLTSVCENPFHGEWNEDADDYDQPDWSKYWSLFDDLELSDEQ
ncbi:MULTISPECIES: hypothetical protein [unclassified Cedecea]|uniref:hypothetical protein n=1 Tax=unclassified Cedecea TaxID=2649846 RepID=UPI00301A20BD